MRGPRRCDAELPNPKSLSVGGGGRRCEASCTATRATGAASASASTLLLLGAVGGGQLARSSPVIQVTRSALRNGSGVLQLRIDERGSEDLYW